MGVSIQDLIVKLSADAREFNKGLDDATKKLNQFGDSSKSTGQSAGLSFDNVAISVTRVATAFAAVGAATIAIATTIGEIAEQGDKLDDLSDAFERLSGTSAVTGLETLRQATRGLITDQELLINTNKALSLGLDPKQYNELAQAAVKLGEAVGKDANESLRVLTESLGRGREAMLAQIGVNIDARAAYEKYAAGIGKTIVQLTEEERLSALRAQALTQLIEQSNKLSDATLSTGDAYSQLKVSITNALGEISRGVNETNNLALGFSFLAEEIDAIDFSKIVSGIGNFLAPAFDFLSQKIDLIIGDFQQLQQAYAGFLDFSLQFAGQSAAEAPQFFDPKAEQKLKTIQQETKKAAVEATTLANNFNTVGKTIKEIGQIDPKNSLFGVNDFLSEYTKATEEFGKKLTEEEKRAHEQGTAFFRRTFENAITGVKFDLEDALKQVAVGFAAEMATNILKTVAPALLTALGGISSPQDLGGQLAGGLFGGGGLGSIFGGAAPAAAEVTTELGECAAAASELTGASSILAGSFGQLGAAALAAATVFGSITGISKLFSGESLGFNEQAALALPTFGLSFFSDQIADLFGSGKDKDQKSRDEVRQRLNEALVAISDDFILSLSSGTKFDIGAEKFFNERTGQEQNTFDIDFQNDPLAASAIGISAALTETLGLTGKLKDDFTALFANVIADGENFNDVIVNGRALFEAFGVSADEMKQSVTEAFLQGQISLDEYNQSLNNLNLIAQDGLPAVGDIGEAFRILTDNIDNPAGQIEAFRLAMVEAAEVGITSVSELGKYLTNTFGVDVTAVFDQIAAAGIGSFESISELAPEQIQLLANLFAQLQTEFEGVTDSSLLTKAAIEKTFEDASASVENFNEAMTTGEIIENAFASLPEYRDDLVNLFGDGTDAVAEFDDAVGGLRVQLENISRREFKIKVKTELDDRATNNITNNDGTLR